MVPVHLFLEFKLILQINPFTALFKSFVNERIAKGGSLKYPFFKTLHDSGMGSILCFID
jgi:hypothetical protein